MRNASLKLTVDSPGRITSVRKSGASTVTLGFVSDVVFLVFAVVSVFFVVVDDDDFLLRTAESTSPRALRVRLVVAAFGII